MTQHDLPTGDLRFLDNAIPPIHDGDYTITAEQTLSGMTPGDTPAPFSASRAFKVAGPRFKIDAAEIHSMYPPPNHSGQFEEQLPHIVLNERMLPWERYLEAGATAAATVSQAGAVTGLILVSGGSGYASAPTVTISSGAGGSGATATATLDSGSGKVTGFVVTSGGSGYSADAPPIVTVNLPCSPEAPWMALLLFNAGAGATATATVSQGGAVTALVLGEAGSGYEIAPAVTIATVAGGGSGATALATINSAGLVTGFVVTNGGTGYTSTTPPSVTIGSPSQAITIPLSDVITPGNDASGLPILGPAITLDAHEEPTSMCRAIDVSITAFAACVPRYTFGGSDELRYAAHVRQVHTGDKAPLGMKKADGWFSTLVAKRFPRALGTAPHQTPNPQIAHLVSLEGLLPYLSAAPSFGTSQMVRVVSLANWTFTCQPVDSASFSALANALTQTTKGTDYLLKLPYSTIAERNAAPAALAQAKGSLDLGYIPLRYQTRQGEFTYAWYRGPLAPVVSTPIVEDPHFATASSAMIYDPNWGIFDQSLAVAWETGRLLALSDKTFSVNILNWRRNGHRLANLLVERLSATDIATLESAGLEQTAARELLGQSIVSQNFMQALIGDFAKRSALKPSPPGTAVSPFPAPTPPTGDTSFTDLQNALGSPIIQNLLKELSGYDSATGKFANAEFEQICEWLASLALLYGVPFKNLVPSAEMLPPNALRFFYLDQNVVNAMIDGAMSIGGQSSRDTLYYAIMRDMIRTTVQSLVRQIRYDLLGQPMPPDPATGGLVSGFLLRSPLVSGWPGLEVKAYGSTAVASVQVSTGGQISLTVASGGSGYTTAEPPLVTISGGAPGTGAIAAATVSAAGQVTGFTMTDAGSGYVASNPPTVLVAPTSPIPLFRMDRLAPDVLLCLFPSVPAWVQIQEPREGLAFGVEDASQTATSPIYLRRIASGPGVVVGELFDSTTFVDASTETDANGVIDLLSLKTAMEANPLLKPELAAKTYQPGALSPGDFALQIVKMPERMIFSLQDPTS